MISQVVTGMIVRCICKCGWVWAPRAVCLWIHLSTLYQILLHRRLVSALPQHFTSSFDYKGVRDEGERFEVFQTRPHHPTTLTTTQQLTHAYSKTRPAQLPHPSPLTHRLTFNLKPFIFLFLFYFNFFSTMQSWKHFALLFLCVNMWMIICYRNVKYVKDHSLFWKNLHLSFWR